MSRPILEIQVVTARARKVRKRPVGPAGEPASVGSMGLVVAKGRARRVRVGRVVTTPTPGPPRPVGMVPAPRVSIGTVPVA